jgi:hypothetical protein
MPENDWLIQVPLSELVALKNMSGEFAKLREENEQLRREIQGLRRVQSEMMQLCADFRKALMSANLF